MIHIDSLMELLDLKTHIEVYCRLSKHFLLHHQATQSTAYFHLLLQGSCTMQSIDGRTFQVAAGDFCLWSHGAAHSIGNATYPSQDIEHHQQHGLNIRRQTTDDNGLHMLCGSFIAQNQAAAHMLSILPEPMIIPLSDIPQVHSLAQLIHTEAHNPQIGSKAMIESLCHVLLLLALRKASQQTENISAIVPLFADTKLARAAQVILASPFAEHTLDSLAEAALMSRATFARKFQAATGMGAQQFIRLLKMSAAAKMLRDNMAVKLVAESVGYHSEAAFVQAFRAQFGCTPSAYRKHNTSTNIKLNTPN